MVKAASYKTEIAKLKQEIEQLKKERPTKREHLSEQHDLYKILIENVPDGVIIHDNKANILFANPAALKMMKVKRLEELGKNKKIFDHILPEYHEEIKNKTVFIKKGKQAPIARYKYRRNDGRVVEFETTAVGIHYKEQEAVLVVYRELELERKLALEKERLKSAHEARRILEKEILKRNKIEEELRKSEEKFREIFENNTDHIFQVSKDLKIEFINFAAPGLNKRKVIGMRLLDFINPEDKARIEGVLKKVFRTGTAQQYDSKYSLHGNEIYYSTKVSPLKIGKEVFAATFISRNITERVRVEQALKESEERYKTLFEKANIPIIQVALNGALIDANKGACKLFGYSKKEIRSKKITELTHKEDRKKIKEEMEKLISHKRKSTHFNKRSVKKNGAIIYANTYINIVRDKNGKPQHLIGVVQDITRQKEDQQKIKNTLEEKEVLLKEIHHRVKNNLQVISSIFNLQASYIKDEKALSLLKENQDRIKSMAYVHESLYQTKDFSNINFSQYISQLANNLTHSYAFDYAEVALREEVESGVTLSLDQAIPCGLIVNELISNALKYAFKEQKDARITIGVKKIEKKIKISIADNGIGFPKQIDFKNTESLGLQLVVSLVEQLSGKIKLEKTKGTKFTIIFKVT